MAYGLKPGLAMAAILALAASGAVAEPDRHRDEGARAEPHPGPSGYQRLAEPQGWNSRPAKVDPDAYRHNYQAARAYRIGPYRPPVGWVARHWVYGQVLPRPYWASRYIIADYWLFALEIPPAGFEWVRVGPDAILVNVYNGEILQVEYGVFG